MVTHFTNVLFRFRMWSGLYAKIEIGSYKTDTVFCNECAPVNVDIK